MLEQQITQWSDDCMAWIGDRALGIHAYEMVRDGNLMSILTKQEIDELEVKGDLRAFDKAVLASIDDDECFYLSAMRQVIDASQKPYYQRLPTFEQINAQRVSWRTRPVARCWQSMC